MSKFSVFAGLTMLIAYCAVETAGHTAVAAMLPGSDDWQAIHRQMGATGKNGYRPLSSRAYQNTARFHSRALNSYGQIVRQIPAETTQEHLAHVQTSVAAVKKEIGKIDAETASKAGVKEHIAVISRHLSECENMCSMVEKSATSGKVDNPGLCMHCSKIDEHLNAVRKEEDAMLKTLGITLPEADQNHHEQDVKK